MHVTDSNPQNGVVANGYIADSSVLNNRTNYFLNYVLDNQDSNGWLGPEVFDSKKPRYLWGRYPFLFGAVQVAEADPSQKDKILNAVYKFVQLANTMLANNQGLEVWGQNRWAEFALTLQWLYDNHPNGQEGLLMDTMIRLRASGHKWEQIFSEQVRLTVNPHDLTLMNLLVLPKNRRRRFVKPFSEVGSSLHTVCSLLTTLQRSMARRQCCTGSEGSCCRLPLQPQPVGYVDSRPCVERSIIS